MKKTYENLKNLLRITPQVLLHVMSGIVLCEEWRNDHSLVVEVVLEAGAHWINFGIICYYPTG